MIRFYCRCGKLQTAPDDQAGKRYLCTFCGTLPMVPRKSEPLADTPDDEPKPPGPGSRSRRIGIVGGAVTALILLGVGSYLAPWPGRPRVASLSPRPGRPMTTEEVIARSEGSVAAIRGRSSRGSGFLAAPGLVVTNAHVIAGEASADIEVRFPSAPTESMGPFPARVVYRDSQRDLALLSVASRLPPLEVDGSPKPKRGRDVVAIGSPGIDPMAMENAIARGVMGPRIGLGSVEFDQLSAAINPGNSWGSPP